MGKKFYISDWHYGHRNIIAFDNRPFVSVEEMNSELIRRWNEVVAPQDTVYVLGDMFWCTTKEAVPVLEKLNGAKVLIKGNHDRSGGDSAFRKQFVKISEYMEIDDDGRKVVLCHYPIPCFKNHFYGWYHLYGHVHNSFEAHMMEHVKREMTDLYNKQCEMYNVGSMMPYINYKPRTLEEIINATNQT